MTWNGSCTIDPHRRILDDDRMLRPAEVVPAARGHALMDSAARSATQTAARQPSTLHAEHKDCAAQQGDGRGVRDARPIARFEVVGHSEPVKAEDLCQSKTALSHPVPSFGFAIDRRHTRNDAGVLGQRLLIQPARHAACSARSGARLTARGAPDSRGAPLARTSAPRLRRCETPPPTSPKSVKNRAPP